MPDDDDSWLEQARSHAAAGDHLLAYDLAMRGLDEHPQDPALKHAAVLALARSGATAKASERYLEFGLGDVPRTGISASLYTDIASLGARIAKDLALAASTENRRELLTEAATRYHKIFDETGDYYPGVNAATLALLAGYAPEARALAASVRTICKRRIGEGLERGYYVWATLAEANLIADDEAAAAEALAQARGAADAKPDALATTRKQLRVLCAAAGVPPSLLDTLRPATVFHYAGHLIGGRLSETQAAALEPRIDAVLSGNQAGVGFGSLASGADIVIAEALLRRGADLELVFPFRLDEFCEISVRPAGKSWIERFERCLARARSRTFATDDSYLGDEYLFTYTTWLGIGLALQRAQSLDTEARRLAIWDGGGAGGQLGAAGTAVDIGLWHSLGLPADVLTPDGAVIDPALAPAPASKWIEAPRGRVLRAMLFGDIKGFSKLTEKQLPVFADKILGAIARTLEGYGSAIDFRNTWGDGLYVVIKDAETAADCALELQRTISELPLASLELPSTLGLRLGGHFGPVFPLFDPVLKQMAFMGSHVSRTARIEPVTPEGMVYVTDAFAAALAATRQPRFVCNYMGVVPAAKNYGSMRMFALSRRTTGPV
ncbi:MAG TPA: TRAFs-binding domain-containing protein [Stellaceae bacterium]|nr:TRAFs-binding domain-containing protein [Stellaceae bacterium]